MNEVEISTLAIKKLQKEANIKSMSNDCIPLIKSLIYNKTQEIINTSLIIKENNTKTLMERDVIEALFLAGNECI